MKKEIYNQLEKLLVYYPCEKHVGHEDGFELSDCQSQDNSLQYLSYTLSL